MKKTCPVEHEPRKDLPPMPERIAALPVDERGYPVPFFVAYVDDKPEFRMMDGLKLRRCVRERLCWVCGEQLGRYLTFPIGPMCAVNRNTAEPPSHLECAQWSVKEGNTAGIMLKRNPGVTCLWTTRSYRVVSDGAKGVLFRIGDPTSVEWWREGRPAALAEVEHSIATGVPALLKICQSDVEKAEMHRAVRMVTAWLPTGELL